MLTTAGTRPSAGREAAVEPGLRVVGVHEVGREPAEQRAQLEQRLRVVARGHRAGRVRERLVRGCPSGSSSVDVRAGRRRADDLVARVRERAELRTEQQRQADVGGRDVHDPRAVGSRLGARVAPAVHGAAHVVLEAPCRRRPWPGTSASRRRPGSASGRAGTGRCAPYAVRPRAGERGRAEPRRAPRGRRPTSAGPTSGRRSAPASRRGGPR